nr:ribonuclease H-like domain-containing protein [Tanacetum cinerariifolium]
IDNIVTILTSLDARVNEEDVIHYALEEMRLKSRDTALPEYSSSSMVLMAESAPSPPLGLIYAAHTPPSLCTNNTDPSSDYYTAAPFAQYSPPLAHYPTTTSSLSPVIGSAHSTATVNDPQLSSSVTPGQATTLPTDSTTRNFHDPTTGLHDALSAAPSDSTRDLYPVTSPCPSSVPQVFLVSQHTWLQRLGHPGSNMLRHLVSNNFILCNKEKPPALYHAYQLGKHVRLPFVSSNIATTLFFDIIHLDVWTLPITSLFGFKYWFPAQTVRASNAIALDSPYLLVLIIEASQSRQHTLAPSQSALFPYSHFTPFSIIPRTSTLSNEVFLVGRSLRYCHEDP